MIFSKKYFKGVPQIIKAFLFILAFTSCGNLVAETSTGSAPAPALPVSTLTPPPAAVITNNLQKPNPIAVIVNPISNTTPAVAITVNQPNAPACQKETPLTCPQVLSPKVNVLPKITRTSKILAPRPVTVPKSTTIPIPPTPSVDIVINQQYKNSPKVRRLYQLLGLTNAPNVIHLVDDSSIANNQDAIIAFKQRTFLSSLYYLRNAVEITPDMIKQGVVEVPKYKNGTYYDPTIITRGLIKIHVCDKRPTRNVNVAVHYRNHWFYILDNDLSSKRTFALMQLMFNITSGNKPITAPVLTLPVR